MPVGFLAYLLVEEYPILGIIVGELNNFRLNITSTFPSILSSILLQNAKQSFDVTLVAWVLTEPVNCIG